MVIRVPLLILFCMFLSVNVYAQSEYRISDLDSGYSEEWLPFNKLDESGIYIKVHRGNSLYKSVCRVRIFQALKSFKRGGENFFVLNDGFNKKGYQDGVIFLDPLQKCEGWEKHKNEIVILEDEIDDYSALKAFNFILNVSHKNLLGRCEGKEKDVSRIGLYKIDAAAIGYKSQFSCRGQLYFINFYFSREGGRVISIGPILS
ncbi:hypothetical protein [Microbulbifer discodermiae]|uniref:hypothetical protein n=1 Tax=Microbulbifer sp. 2201CG32-9 TaxID=3232309 RepID=UPI00345B91C3